MGSINIANSKGRDAVVSTQSTRVSARVRYLDAKQRQAQSSRVVKSTIASDIEALTRQAGSIERISEKLVKSDADVDMEVAGRLLKETSRVFVNVDGQVVHKVKQFEVIRNPDGSERERRPRKALQPNTATEIPLKWTGKLIKKADVYRKYVFANQVQIMHINGLTYDFLFSMAKELEQSQSLMLVGSGPKGAGPLVFIRGGQQYRGFLEGRTDGDKYCLLLHLSNMELKTPKVAE